MTHKFEKGAEVHACGMVDLMLQAIEDHEREMGKRRPVFFLLHPATSAVLNDEHYKRYGVPHGMQFAGIKILLCPCQDKPASCPYPMDKVAYQDGSLRML